MFWTLSFLAIFRKVFILLEVKILATGNEVGARIGNPTPFTEGAAAPKPAPQNKVVHASPQKTRVAPATRPTPLTPSATNGTSNSRFLIDKFLTHYKFVKCSFEMFNMH